MNAVEIQAIGFGQHIELVGDGEVQVSPTVGEQLGQLGFQGRQFYDGGCNGEEQIARAANRDGIEARDDLRQLDQFLHSIAFGNALRTEGQIDIAGKRSNSLVHELGNAGADGAPQHQQRSILDVLQSVVQTPVKLVDRGIQVAVNGSADDSNDDVGRAQTVWVSGGPESLSQNLLENGLSAILAERHDAGVDGLDFGRIDIEQGDGQAMACQDDAQGQSDMATTAYDHNVLRCWHRSFLSRGSGSILHFRQQPCHLPPFDVGAPGESAGKTVRARAPGPDVYMPAKQEPSDIAKGNLRRWSPSPLGFAQSPKKPRARRR